MDPFTASDAKLATALLERQLESAWVLCGVMHTTVKDNARETLRALTTNAISLLARPGRPSSVTWDTLRKSFDTGRSVSRHAADQILMTEFQEVLRCVIGLSVLDDPQPGIDFAILFAYPSSSGKAANRIGSTAGQNGGVIGVALSGQEQTPIAIVRELLENSRDQPGHAAYDAERVRRFEEMLGAPLAKSLAEEVVAILKAERTAFATATGSAHEAIIPADRDVDLAGLRVRGFPSTVLATDLRIPQWPAHEAESRYLGANAELVTAVLGCGFKVVFQALALTGAQAANRPQNIVRHLGVRGRPQIMWVTQRELQTINKHSDLLTTTGRTIVPSTTRYWTATQVINGKRVCTVGRYHLRTSSHQVFRVGPWNDEAGTLERTLSLIEVAVRHQEMLTRVRRQLAEIQPLKLGGQRPAVHRMAMTIMNAAYALLLSARRRRLNKE